MVSLGARQDLPSGCGDPRCGGSVDGYGEIEEIWREEGQWGLVGLGGECAFGGVWGA